MLPIAFQIGIAKFQRIQSLVKRLNNNGSVESLIEVMSTYLFAWNQRKWPWNELADKVKNFNLGGEVCESWICASFRSARIGDRAFFMKLGCVHRGIFGSGVIRSNPFLAQHFNAQKPPVYQVLIQFDVLLNASHGAILPIERLKSEIAVKQNWTPQASGTEIYRAAAEQLEEHWFNFLNERMLQQSIRVDYESCLNLDIYEGQETSSLKKVLYRSPFARKLCLNHYGYSCYICGFNFEEKFGPSGRGIIDVHHLSELGKAGGARIVNPIEDLRPLCPNCHAMIHRNRDGVLIDDLKRLIESKNRGI